MRKHFEKQPRNFSPTEKSSLKFLTFLSFFVCLWTYLCGAGGIQITRTKTPGRIHSVENLHNTPTNMFPRPGIGTENKTNPLDRKCLLVATSCDNPYCHWLRYICSLYILVALSSDGQSWSHLFPYSVKTLCFTATGVSTEYGRLFPLQDYGVFTTFWQEQVVEPPR